MNEFSYLELARLVAPELLVVLGALAVLGMDLLILADEEVSTRITLCTLFVTVVCAVAVAWMFGFPVVSEPGGLVEVNRLTQAVKIALLVLALFSFWLTQGSSLRNNIGEYFALLLLSASGMMLLISSRDLLTLFVSLELSTIPLYALAGFRKDAPEAGLSALKYFLMGSVSAALTLFGFSLLYGFSGAIDLRQIAAAIPERPFDPLLLMGAILALGGIGFKLAAAPFHLWAPDVYQTAPTPSAAFIGSASKLAGIFVLGILFTQGLSGETAGPVLGGNVGWLAIVAAAAAFSIIVGNLAAMAQSDLRRLLAFSAVGHAGFMLLGLLSNDKDSLVAVFYYATTYGLATLGAFGVAAVVAGDRTGCAFSRLDGLHSRNPLLAASMLIFILSLAGIPPMGGFLAKFLVFAMLLKPNPAEGIRIALLALGLAASAVSLYYYLRVLKSVYVRPAEAPPARTVSPAVTVLLLAAALIVVLLGVFPHLLLEPFLEWAPL